MSTLHHEEIHIRILTRSTLSENIFSPYILDSSQLNDVRQKGLKQLIWFSRMRVRNDGPITIKKPNDMNRNRIKSPVKSD